MPIVHTCKACGCQVTEAEVARGQAVRKGKFTYCGECSALILDPVEMAAPAAPAAAARPARQAPPAHQGLPAPDESPTGRQNALARNGIEVVEEFEIMSGNDDVPDLDAALEGEGDDVGHDDQADIDTNPGAEPLDEAPAPARPSARAARAGRSARGDRGAGGSGSRRGVGGRGTNLGRRQQARASARGAGGSSSRRPAAPAAKPESRRGAKEVFYKSGAKAAAINSVDVADQGGNAVESNVLDAVRANQARKAAGGGGSGSRRSQRNAGGGGRSSSRMSGRSSSRTSGRGGEEGGRGSMRGRAPSGGNNQTIIIGSIAGVIVLIGLVLMLSGSGNKGGNRSSGGEGHVSAGTYAGQAKEKERAGDRIGAYELYLKAADAAEAAGRDEEARRYTMQAYAMQKHSTLQMGK